VPESSDPKANQAPVINFIEVTREDAKELAAANGENGW